MAAKDRLLTSKRVECNKIYEKKFDENLSKIVESTHQFCDGNINKFGLMLQKTVYSREYLSGWKRLYETPLPTKKEFCSNLTMENIIDTDYKNVKRVQKDLASQNLGHYHNLYVQSDKLLLVNVFENFRNNCLEINEINSDLLLPAPGLIWQSPSTDSFCDIARQSILLSNVTKAVCRWFQVEKEEFLIHSEIHTKLR